MAKTPLFSWMSRMIRQSLQANLRQTNQEVSPTTPHALANISRRDFLKTLGTTSALAALSLYSGTKGWTATALSTKGPQSPVVIIGAGLGGLVTAYRLAQQNIPCVLYEASHRAGGRVYTQYGFNPDAMFVELGGELVDTVHEDLISLCEELSIPLERFETVETEAARQILEPALYYSEGTVHTLDEVLEAFRPLAKILADDLALCFPNGEIQIPTYNQPCNAAWLDQLSLEEYLNRHMSSANVAPWVIRIIKTAYTGEYGLEPQEQSALNLLLLIGTDVQNGFRMFGDSDEAMRIQGGNSRLVQTLTAALQGRVEILYGHSLQRISRLGEQIRLAFRMGGQSLLINADQVVLALPLTILRNLQGIDTLGLSAVKLQCIQEWGYGTNSKQMIGFHSRFWQQAHPNMPACSGELVTDLPGQCYWDTSRLQAGNRGILTNFLGGRAGLNASSQQWQKTLSELDSLYGKAGQQFDGSKAFFNWANNPLAQGSYTCPKPGQYTRLMGEMQNPELGGRLLFAGEHCSLEWCGYMNGAVQSGNQAAMRIILQKGAQAVDWPLSLVLQ